jgi:hypothetical protein
MSEKSSSEAAMPLMEAAIGLKRLAEPIPAGDKVKSQIARAAKAAKLSYTRAKDLWYGDARSVHPEELEAIRNAQSKRRPADELLAIATDFEALAERAAKVLAASDRSGADAFRLLARRARSLGYGA